MEETPVTMKMRSLHIDVIIVISIILVFSACGSKTVTNLAETEANAARAAQPSPSPAFETLTSETVLNAFKEAKLPITNVEIYTEETDRNNLLARPHQYVGKINWGDARAKNIKVDKSPNTIEVFTSAEDLEARKTYTETISRSGGMFNQYIFSHKNVLLRLTHQLLPKDAEEYERILRTL